jgi:hypothetical protein
MHREVQRHVESAHTMPGPSCCYAVILSGVRRQPNGVEGPALPPQRDPSSPIQALEDLLQPCHHASLTLSERSALLITLSS